MPLNLKGLVFTAIFTAFPALEPIEAECVQIPSRASSKTKALTRKESPAKPTSGGDVIPSAIEAAMFILLVLPVLLDEARNSIPKKSTEVPRLTR